MPGIRNININLATGQFETLILPHKSSLYGPALQMTHSASDAEDLVQETILRAFTRFDSFRADGSPRAWLHTIMRNLFINTYRKKNREPRMVSFDSLDDPDTFGSIADGTMHKPALSSPERVVLSKMEGAALMRAVKSLPQDYREAVMLSDVHGMSYQEIADQLGIPVGTVRSRLNRGRKRVQRALFSWRGGDASLSPAAHLSPLPA